VRLEDLGMEGLMAQHPHLRGWYKRIQANRSVETDTRPAYP
jgi:hypothetical protein